ncbi:MAG: universal stress protein [Carbonactinosporaceae bacterium]
MTDSNAGYKKILVGTDGSESSLRAVERAAAVAHAAGGDLTVLCAYDPPRAREVEEAQEALGDEAYKVVGSNPAEEALRAARERAAGVGLTDVETAAVADDPVDALVDVMDKRDVDLLVVGNRGLNTLAGRVLGSVPSDVARRASCDVLIVRTTKGGRWS